MRREFLSFSPPALGQEEIDEVVDTLRSDWITTGPKARRFEQEFAEYVGAAAALAVFSATDAMQVGLAALGVGVGDDVITTAMTFCSTVHVIEHLGAKPVLVDVEEDTLCIDPARVDGGRDQVILPVHLYGHPCGWTLTAIASRHGLSVLEMPPTRCRRVPGTDGRDDQLGDGVQLLRDENAATAEGHVDRRQFVERTGVGLCTEAGRLQTVQR
jgi:dTDP-4-amino-4,6-dideoxygalactose transaminase